MYTLLELQAKTFGELKKIGHELNVFPEGDRRRRQSWIDAIAGVNPPLLQLLEVSPGVEVEQVQNAIEEAAKTSPGVDVDPVHKPIIETVEDSPAAEVKQAQERIKEYFDISELRKLDEPDCPACGGIHSLKARWSHEYILSFWIISCQKCDSTCTCSIEELPPCLQSEDDEDDKKSENVLGLEVYAVEELIEQAAKKSPGVEADLAQEQLIETKFGRIVYPRPAQEPIALAGKTPPGVDLDDELPECSTCFGDGYIEDEFGFVKFCQCKTEPKLSHKKTQRAIEPAAKTGSKAEADLNPILTGIRLSDNFLARYSLPHPEYVFSSDADAQLSLLNFDVVAEPEPPDPDDFESIEAFRDAIARWDWEHPSSSDHCSDQLPSSEDNDVSSEDNDVSSEDKPLELSLDSFCLWAHCPADWYEPAEVLEPSKVMELSPIHKNSSTSDFFIPTFDSLGDRSNRSDEPPDTGIFARLPKPKPPTFPPQAARWTQVGRKLDTSWTQVGHQPKAAQVSLSQPKSVPPETLPKLFHRVVAGNSVQPARSPPGGDA
jgi:hypothetical protein